MSVIRAPLAVVFFRSREAHGELSRVSPLSPVFNLMALATSARQEPIR